MENFIVQIHLLTKYKKLIVKDNSNKRLDMDFRIKSSNSNSEYIIKIKQETLYSTSKEESNKNNFVLIRIPKMRGFILYEFKFKLNLFANYIK